MIRYSLRCAGDHGFESWFKGADAFAALQAAGQVECPVCGSAEVRKELMAPAVRPARKAAANAVQPQNPVVPRIRDVDATVGIARHAHRRQQRACSAAERGGAAGAARLR